VATVMRAQSAIRQGLSEAEECRSAREWRGTQTPQALILYAQAEAQQPREKVGTVSSTKCAHLTVSLHLARVGHVAVPHVVTVRHVAHYRADLASPKDAPS
jgi:hypothetical protein